VIENIGPSIRISHIAVVTDDHIEIFIEDALNFDEVEGPNVAPTHKISHNFQHINQDHGFILTRHFFEYLKSQRTRMCLVRLQNLSNIKTYGVKILPNYDIEGVSDEFFIVFHVLEVS
jgi:hypothetical protein